MNGRKLVGVMLALVVVFVVIALVLVRLVGSLDLLVAREMERWGSEITGTAVKVGKVEIDLATGRSSVSGMSIANPPGYEAPYAFLLGRMTMQIDPKSLIERKPLVIEISETIAPQVFYESDGKLGSNIQTIVDNVNAFVKRIKKDGYRPPSPGVEPPPMRIDRFTFAKGTLKADFSRLKEDKVIEAEMPSVSLRNLGGRSGAPPEQIGAELARRYAEAALTAVAKKEVRGRLHDIIDDKTGDAAETLKGIVDSILD